ncbi:MAG: hypothetical protein WDM92_05415 [Caulobacteraceae bacterium]
MPPPRPAARRSRPTRPSSTPSSPRVGEAAAQSSAVAPRILRATENLRTALRLKLAQGGIGEDRLTAIVRIIDEAAAAVERV